MPGVFGLFSKMNKESEESSALCLERLDAMTSAMRYESLYVQRQFVCRDLGAYVGWCGPIVRSARLALDRRDGLSVLLSGEPICGVAAERGGAESQSLNILDLYLRTGEDFIFHINGSFSGILIDKRAGHWFIFNDRFGVERLFFYEDDSCAAFSTEAKAILEAFPKTRSFDPEGVSQFIACGYTFDAHSLYQKIGVLPVSSIVKFAVHKNPEVRTYFHQSSSGEGEPLTEQRFVAGFSERLADVLGKYLSLYSRAGVSLTGGLDTRMIMACLNAPVDSVPCYTFGSMYRETFDVREARRIAKLSRQPYEVLTLNQEFLSSFAQYLLKAVLASDGYLGFSGAAELYLNALASSRAPLRITGNYGGELLRGTGAFNHSIPHSDFLKPGLQKRVTETARRFDALRQTKPLSFKLALQAAAGFGRYAIERSQVSQVTPFLDKDLVDMVCGQTNLPGFHGDPSVHVIEKRQPALLTVPTDRGLLGRGGYAARAGRRLQREALFKLEYWTGECTPNLLERILLGTGLDVLCERLFTGRHKFQHFRIWLRRELANEVRELLGMYSASPLDEYFDLSKVMRMMDDHESGKRNNTEGVDRVTTLVLAQKLLLSGGPRKSKCESDEHHRSRAKTLG